MSGNEKFLHEDSAVDTVIVGAGPVGLFLGILLKLRCPAMKLCILEKHTEYQRKHVLCIEERSLETDLENTCFRRQLRDLVGKVPTHQIEHIFQSLAKVLEIDIRKGVCVEDITFLDRFSSARYIIGADGRRSIIRAQRFGDKLVQDYTVMRLAMCKYEVRGITEAHGWLKYMALLGDSNVHHTVQEVVGKPKDGFTAVTLQFFVTAKEFDELQARQYSFKNPCTLENLRGHLPLLACTVQTWLNSRAQEFAEDRVTPVAMTPVPLDVYESAEVVTLDTSGPARARVWALVGDAAFAVPFFRALNDGLRCANQLSRSLADHFSSRELRAPTDSVATKQEGIEGSDLLFSYDESLELQKERSERQNGKGIPLKGLSKYSSLHRTVSDNSDPLRRYRLFSQDLVSSERAAVNMKAAAISSAVTSVDASRHVVMFLRRLRSRQSELAGAASVPRALL
jgi:2-polyprenyl-6-methoxyphenol hydroxylase-like FAD-dependent oxidoreductase